MLILIVGKRRRLIGHAGNAKKPAPKNFCQYHYGRHRDGGCVVLFLPPRDGEV